MSKTAMVRIPPEDPVMDHLRSFLEELATRMVTALKAEIQAGEKPPAPRLPPRSTEAPPLKAYLSRTDAAEYLGYSKTTIERYIKAGWIKASGPHGDRIQRFELDRFMAEAGRRRRPANTQDGKPEQTEADEIAAEADRIFTE